MTIRPWCLGLVAVGLSLLAWLASAEATARVTVTWNDCTGEDGYKIDRAGNGGAFVEVGTVGANVLSFVQTAVPEGVAYSYRVRCYNSFDPVGVASPATSPFTPGSPTAPAWSIGVTFTKE